MKPKKQKRVLTLWEFAQHRHPVALHDLLKWRMILKKVFYYVHLRMICQQIYRSCGAIIFLVTITTVITITLSLVTLTLQVLHVRTINRTRVHTHVPWTYVIYVHVCVPHVCVVCMNVPGSRVCELWEFWCPRYEKYPSWCGPHNEFIPKEHIVLPTAFVNLSIPPTATPHLSTCFATTPLLPVPNLRLNWLGLHLEFV